MNTLTDSHMWTLQHLVASALLILSLQTAAEPTRPPKVGQFTALRTEGYLTYYSGTATVEGVVERWTDDDSLEVLGDEICFIPNEKSSQTIPPSPGRMSWFCFSNRDKALGLLGIPAKRSTNACGYTLTAKVVITDYVSNSQESEVFDTARLVKVKMRDRPHHLACKQ